MKYPQIYISKNRLDNLFSQVSTFQVDEQILSHWAKYLCVLVSGFLETSISAIYVEYVSSRSHRNVSNFVEAELEYFTNPNMEKIIQLAGSFNTEWASALRSDTEGPIKEAIDSIRADRNQIAHGESIGLTIGTMKEYYKYAVKLVELIEKQCYS
jgi:hypothetical protein